MYEYKKGRRFICTYGVCYGEKVTITDFTPGSIQAFHKDEVHVRADDVSEWSDSIEQFESYYRPVRLTKEGK